MGSSSIKTLKIGGGAVGLDIETTGLNFTRKRIVSIQISTEREQFFFDWRNQDSIANHALRKILEDESIIKIVHNSAFDCSFIKYQLGIDTRNIWDTRLMENIILGIGTIPMHLQKNPEVIKKYSTSLKHTLARYKLAKLEKETAKTFLGMTDGAFSKQQIEYALNDVRYLHQLMEMQKKKIKKLKLERLAELENKCAEVIYTMRCNGINFDEKYWLKLADMNEKKVADIIKRLDRISKGAVKNWNSPVQTKKWLNSIGIPITSLSDLHTGQHQRKEYLAGQSKALDTFIELTESSKYVTTYGRGWLKTDWSKEEKDEPTLGPDGRVHCDFNQIIDTGRLSCSKPNLQQITSNKYDSVYQSHRRSFIPTKGYLFGIGDFSGQELGIMAAGSDETKWIDIIESGQDLHSHMALFMFPQKWADATEKNCEFKKSMRKCDCKGHKFLRQFSKTLTFGLPYGKGPLSIADDLGISAFQAKQQVRTFKKGAPNLTKWLDDNASYAEENYEIRTLPPFNRWRNLILEEESWRRINKGLNTPVQGSAADMIKLAMVNMHEHILKKNLKARILLQVHDELITEAPLNYIDKWLPQMKEIMEDAAMVITKRKVITVKPVKSDWWHDKSV